MIILKIPDLEILQLNTDGITIKILKSQVDKYYEVCKKWESITNLVLEYVNYRKMIIRDVNSYIAIYENGKVKLKGAFKTNEQLVKDSEYHKSFHQGIVSLSILNYFVDNIPVGFVAIKLHNEFTGEVYVMGVLQDYHRQGIGQALINCCSDFCIRHKMEFLTVKTLDESRPNNEYAQTRVFYRKMGFKPLEVFTTLWDEDNPCLFLVKNI